MGSAESIVERLSPLADRPLGALSLEDVWTTVQAALREPIDGVDDQLDEDLLLFEAFHTGAPYPRSGEDYLIAFTRQYTIAGDGDMQHISLLLRWSPVPERAVLRVQVQRRFDEMEDWVRRVTSDHAYAAAASLWPPMVVEVESGLI